MNRQLISVAIGNIRDDHITAALLYTPKARANHYSRETNRPRPTKRMIAIVLAAALLLLQLMPPDGLSLSLQKSVNNTMCLIRKDTNMPATCPAKNLKRSI